VQLFISVSLITIGTFFILIAGLGLVRMPDLFLRMSASTKAATLGVGCTLLGVAFYFGDFSMFIRAGAIIIFLLLTAPVAAHLIGRAAYQDGVPLWKGTQFDDLSPHYPRKVGTAQPPEVAEIKTTARGRSLEITTQETG
jgi:multicomponent Na+:H+ antiporter subunit G